MYDVKFGAGAERTALRTSSAQQKSHVARVWGELEGLTLVVPAWLADRDPKYLFIIQKQGRNILNAISESSKAWKHVIE